MLLLTCYGAHHTEKVEINTRSEEDDRTTQSSRMGLALSPILSKVDYFKETNAFNGIFNQVLKQALQGCPLPDGVTLVQYVDDLLIAAPTAEVALQATQSVLRLEKGFKVSKDKLQIARTAVTFLGRVLSGAGTGLSPAHRSAILHYPKPITVKDMLSFLGLTGYSRTYIPDYTGLTQPLRALVREHGLRNLRAPLNWDQASEEAFITLKQRLAQAADLALPDYSLPFHLDVSETGEVINGILFQKKGGERRVLMYVSVKLDTTEKRHPTCTRHVAGVAKIIQKTAHIVMGHPLHILTSHSVVAYVNSQTFTMTSLRQQRLSKILEAPNLNFSHEGINMADHMSGGEPHECEYRVQKEEKVRPDLGAGKIEETEDWFTDGCCFITDTGGLQAGYAVVARQGQDYVTLKADRLGRAESAQRAEVIAVVEALKLAEEKEVTIYSDSAYAVGAVHVELSQWLRAGFLTAGNKPIKHKAEMRELAKALMLPKKVAVVKCKGHEGSGTMVAKVRAADEEAKRVTGYVVSKQMITVEEGVHPNYRLTLEKALGLRHAFGTVYHPQSQGKVERMNQTIKQKLAKICAQTKMNWVDALPLAMMSVRCSINRGTRFTPFELQTGRQFPGPQKGLTWTPD
ncbi:uncharacterized protein [Paramormyrops kingsleyae]|uniref:uncharacterized protein isoform X2 n=1 Tax=Paramormyrops kingsleyae TaxID=1676925 RepID=UPI003B97B2EC